MLHVALAVILIMIGYPAGRWAIINYLTIPDTRIADCVWVWRFVCCSCFVSMINVPFRAMYTAKQEIAELTIYSFVSSSLNAVVLYYMVTHPSLWLKKFMLWTCLVSVIPQFIIMARACAKYKECTIVYRYFWGVERVKSLMGFVGGRFIYAVASMLSIQGSTILVNKMMGPVRNAAMSVGGTVSSHCLTLSSAVSSAFSPAITQSAGEGNLLRMKKMMLVTCTMSSLSVLIFTLPLLFESRTVLKLWLKEPPEWSAVVCVIVLIQYVFARITDGLWMGIFAVGKIARYQAWEAVMQFSVLPIAYMAIKLGADIVGVAIAQVIASMLNVIVKLYFAQKLCAISVVLWIKKVFLPVLYVSLLAALPGFCVAQIFRPSIYRVILTTFCIEAVFLILAWYFVTPIEVRDFLVKKIRLKYMRG